MKCIGVQGVENQHLPSLSPLGIRYGQSGKDRCVCTEEERGADFLTCQYVCFASTSASFHSGSYQGP